MTDQETDPPLFTDEEQRQIHKMMSGRAYVILYATDRGANMLLNAPIDIAAYMLRESADRLENSQFKVRSSQNLGTQ